MKIADSPRTSRSPFETHFGLPLRGEKSSRAFHDALRDAGRATHEGTPPLPGELPAGPDRGSRRRRDDEEPAGREVDFTPITPINGDAVALTGASPKAERATTPRADLQPVFDRIVVEAAVAHDAHRRKVVLLELAVPGRGTLRARIVRGRHGTEVRLRTLDESLRTELRARHGELSESARRHGVAIARIDVH